MTKRFLSFLLLIYSASSLCSSSSCPDIKGLFMCSAVGERREKMSEEFKDKETFFDISTKYVNRSGETRAIYTINGKSFLESEISQQSLDRIKGRFLTCTYNKFSLWSIYTYDEVFENSIVREQIRAEVEKGEHPLEENLHIEKVDPYKIRILKELENEDFYTILECSKT